MENKTISISIDQLFYIGRQVRTSDCPSFSMILMGMNEEEIGALLDTITKNCKQLGFSPAYNFADHFIFALNHGAKVYKCYLKYSIDILNYYESEITSNKMIQFFNLIFKNVPVTEEIFVENYDKLKQFKFAIFKGNPKLKASNALKCLMAVSGDSNNVYSENIKTYIRNRTPNKLESFKNITIDDIRTYPGVINWKKILSKLRINTKEYKRLPPDIEAEFAKYVRRTERYENARLTQSYDVLNYYYLYCFDLHNTVNDYRHAASVLFMDPDKAMSIDKTAYFEIFYELLANSVNYSSKDCLKVIKNRFLTPEVFEKFINDKFKNFYNSLGMRTDFLYEVGKGSFWRLEWSISQYSTTGFLTDLKNMLLNGLYNPYRKMV